MKFNALSKSTKTRVFTIAILLVLTMLLAWAENYPDFVEHWYSEGIYPFIAGFLHVVFNVFLFSVGDVFYVVLVICIISASIQLFRLLLAQNFAALVNYLLKVIMALQLIYLVFYVFWGLNYYRPSAANRLNLRDTAINVNNIKTLATVLIDSANICRARLHDADFKLSNDSVYAVAVQAVGALPGQWLNISSRRLKLKSSLLSGMLNYLQTAGYYDPFTGESQVNYLMPMLSKPVTACHELSHQIGFAAEDEADFVGFVAGVSSRNNLLRYSAYSLGITQFMSALHHRDSISYKALKARIAPLVLADLHAESAYWKSFEGRTGTISGIFYDHFLKANNQPHGLKTYNRMIRLTMAWYKRNNAGVFNGQRTNTKTSL